MMKIQKESLINTYKLISLENRHVTGEITYPLGSDATGILNYTANGFYFIHLMANNRPFHKENNLLSGTLEEIERSYRSYFSYAGTFHIEDNDIIHHVTYSSLPNWANTDQRRTIKWNQKQLMLSAKNVYINNELVEPYVIWEPISTKSI
ncbi:lipocalin-like domain-containing protein [uncultured Shewanella sp.]|uniref:lipocalin-like domain-containing protein n=1 Tax=uncultured Shewanella sp. TaxID=173975 RepID=UPI0026169686|nr:lipocalin-like domain-containing protein [uncultured Shewanella sp.]